MKAPIQQRYSFGPFVLDPVEKVLFRQGEPISLPLKALETLLVLVESHGHLVEKAELLKRVWPDTFVEEATLAQNILTLRKVLDGSSGDSRYIGTVPRRGYRFVAPVKLLQRQLEALERMETGFARTLASRSLLWAVTGILLVVIAVGIYLRIRSRNTAAVVHNARVTLAVLPFENLSGDPKQEYFSDGLTEEMIAQLSRLNPEGLSVIARTSAMQYKGAAKGVAQIGRELGVDYILESSVRREADRVRVTTQLVRVSDQTHLWSQSYERDARGVLALQEEVASDVASQIALKLNPSSAERPARETNLAAYEAYLRGRFFWNKRSEQGYLKAIEYFQQAIAADPGYGQPYSGLADAYALLGSNPTTAIARKEAMAKARAAALRALSIDETLAEAHTSLAFIYWHYDWNWPAAEKEFQRALQLNSSYPTAHQWYAYYLLSQNRIDQALEEIRRAQETDPLSLIINADGAEVLCLAQHYDEAITQAKKALEMDPDFPSARRTLVWSYFAEHQHREAVEEAKKGVREPGANPDAEVTLAVAYALAGQKAQARELLLKLKGESERLHTEQLSAAVANVYAALGEKDQAFAWLEKVFQNRDGGLTLIKLIPYLAPLHGDPRFADLVRRIGLPP